MHAFILTCKHLFLCTCLHFGRTRRHSGLPQQQQHWQQAHYSRVWAPSDELEASLLLFLRSWGARICKRALNCPTNILNYVRKRPEYSSLDVFHLWSLLAKTFERSKLFRKFVFSVVPVINSRFSGCEELIIWAFSDFHVFSLFVTRPACKGLLISQELFFFDCNNLRLKKVKTSDSNYINKGSVPLRSKWVQMMLSCLFGSKATLNGTQPPINLIYCIYRGFRVSIATV